jgi:hypothetical protein
MEHSSAGARPIASLMSDFALANLTLYRYQSNPGYFPKGLANERQKPKSGHNNSSNCYNPPKGAAW